MAPLHRAPARNLQATQQRPLDYRQLLISRAIMSADGAVQVSRTNRANRKLYKINNNNKKQKKNPW